MVKLFNKPTQYVGEEWSTLFDQIFNNDTVEINTQTQKETYGGGEYAELLEEGIDEQTNFSDNFENEYVDLTGDIEDVVNYFYGQCEDESDVLVCYPSDVGQIIKFIRKNGFDKNYDTLFEMLFNRHKHIKSLFHIDSGDQFDFEIKITGDSTILEFVFKEILNDNLNYEDINNFIMKCNTTHKDFINNEKTLQAFKEFLMQITSKDFLTKYKNQFDEFDKWGLLENDLEDIRKGNFEVFYTFYDECSQFGVLVPKK